VQENRQVGLGTGDQEGVYALVGEAALLVDGGADFEADEPEILDAVDLGGGEIGVLDGDDAEPEEPAPAGTHRRCRRVVDRPAPLRGVAGSAHHGSSAGSGERTCTSMPNPSSTSVRRDSDQ